MPDNSMFRYLMKYVGKYRVLTELTTNTNDFVRDKDGNIHKDYDELYIPCAYDGKIKHTYIKGVLCYLNDKKSTLKKIVTSFENDHIKYELEECDKEYIIYFNDSDMSKVAKIVSAKTAGKKIKPFDERNIPNRIIAVGNINSKEEIISNYIIPSKDITKMYKILSPIKDRSTKIQLTKGALSEFIKSNEKLRGIKSNMDKKELIHSMGMWEEYLKMLSEKVEKI